MRKQFDQTFIYIKNYIYELIYNKLQAMKKVIK